MLECGPNVVVSQRHIKGDRADDLLRAMEEALDLGSEAETSAACRERAAEFDWPQVAEAYEGLYESILEAPDRDELLHWLARRPLVVAEDGKVLVNAGLLPDWSAE